MTKDELINKIIGTKFSDWIENFDEESGIATYVLSSDISIHLNWKKLCRMKMRIGSGYSPISQPMRSNFE